MDLKKSIGLNAAWTPAEQDKFIKYINLKLASMGCPVFGHEHDGELVELISAMLLHHRETDRLLANYLCPADWRIQKFLDDYLYDCQPVPKLPSTTFVL